MLYILDDVSTDDGLKPKAFSIKFYNKKLARNRTFFIIESVTYYIEIIKVFEHSKYNNIYENWKLNLIVCGKLLNLNLFNTSPYE